jgi:hypothetical protein
MLAHFNGAWAHDVLSALVNSQRVAEAPPQEPGWWLECGGAQLVPRGMARQEWAVLVHMLDALGSAGRGANLAGKSTSSGAARLTVRNSMDLGGAGMGVDEGVVCSPGSSCAAISHLSMAHCVIALVRHLPDCAMRLLLELGQRHRQALHALLLDHMDAASWTIMLEAFEQYEEDLEGQGEMGACMLVPVREGQPKCTTSMPGLFALECAGIHIIERQATWLSYVALFRGE